MTKRGANDWTILYHPTVIKKDIPILPLSGAKRIRKAIEEKLATNPALYGFPLHGSLKNLFKLRVGDWRVVYSITDSKILILVIGNRKDVYRVAGGRVG